MNGRILVSLAVAGVLCTGCDTMKEKLGLTRHTPDEFAVMQRAPLEIPTDLNTLPRPQPGMARPQDVTALQQAQTVILGTEKQAGEVSSSGEDALLKKTGAGAAPSNIREQLAKDATETTNDKRAVVKKLLNLGSDAAPATVVDPAAEAKRIQDAKKAGQSVTSGETPTLEE